MLEPLLECFLCSAPCPAPCPHCRLVAACPAHTALHRAGERCAAWRVARLPGRGAALLATREIRPPELVLAELPAVVGPYTQISQPQVGNVFSFVW